MCFLLIPFPKDQCLALPRYNTFRKDKRALRSSFSLHLILNNSVFTKNVAQCQNLRQKVIDLSASWGWFSHSPN